MHAAVQLWAHPHEEAEAPLEQRAVLPGEHHLEVALQRTGRVRGQGRSNISTMSQSVTLPVTADMC